MWKQNWKERGKRYLEEDREGKGKKYGIAVSILLLLVGLLSGCTRVLETASDSFDNMMGNLLSSMSSEEYDDDTVSVRILTPTPTPGPELSPTPTLPPTPTPRPSNMEPEGETVDEWVYAISSVNIRSGWSTDYRIIGGLNESDKIHRVALLENGWSKVCYNSGYAYINSSYLTTVTPTKVGTVHIDTVQYTYNAIFNGEDVVMLGVQNILQKPDLPAGPEITCLAIVLKYLGLPSDKVSLAENYLITAEPGTASPFEAYLGDPKVSEGSYGCYAPVIALAANRYFADRGELKQALDVSGSTLEELLGFVQNGTPVIAWATVSMVASKNTAVWEIDGEELVWKGNEHCVVLMGYNKTQNTVIVADPLRGLMEYDMEKFYTRYKEQYSSAVIISNR